MSAGLVDVPPAVARSHERHGPGRLVERTRAEPVRLTLDVYSPRFWWRVDATNLRRWVNSDPDTDDGRQRWEDRDEQRWDLITEAVHAASEALAAGEWAPVEEEGSLPDHGRVTITVPARPTATEEKIVRTWFRAGQGVVADPWFPDLVNGWHRLWATLPHHGGALVPLRSSALSYANAADVDALGPTWHQLFADNLDALGTLAWFAHDDPLNQRFAQALQTAARGRIPDPA